MTETRLIQQELIRFFKSTEPEVLCITGAWGVGKTFITNQIYQNLKEEKKLALNSYSYVSLFGCESFDGLKRQIFDNQEQVILSDDTPVEATKSKAFGLFKSVKKHLGTVEATPIVGEYLKALSTIYFSTIRNTTVCIDDLERRGASLRIEDVLGLISYLKEQKQCKVILILNEDALEEGDQEKFKKLLEKTIDSKLLFAPTSNEAVEITLKNNDHVSGILAKHCITLNINNIRIINKIARSAKILDTILKNTDQKIRDAALHTLVLASWSLYQPDIAPPLDFIFKNRHPDWITLERARELNDKEKKME